MGNNRKLGIVCIIGTTLFWGTAPVFIRYFSKYLALDPFTQNFFRYLAAMFFLWIVTGLFFRKQLGDVLRKPQRFIVPVLVLVLLQISWVVGLRIIQPAIGLVISRFRVLLCAVAAYFLFHDERTSIRDPKFIIGTLVALGGGAVLVLSGEVENRVYVRGIIYMLVCSVIGTGYMLVAKYLRDLNPVASFTVISTGTALVFFVLMIGFGDASSVLEAGAGVNFLLALSGILCIGIAHSLLYTAINALGAAVSSSFTIGSPIFTAVIAYAVFSDALSWVQIISGAAIIAGSFLVLRASKIVPTQS